MPHAYRIVVITVDGGDYAVGLTQFVKLVDTLLEDELEIEELELLEDELDELEKELELLELMLLLDDTDELEELDTDELLLLLLDDDSDELEELASSALIKIRSSSSTRGNSVAPPKTPVLWRDVPPLRVSSKVARNRPRGNSITSLKRCAPA